MDSSTPKVDSIDLSTLPLGSTVRVSCSLLDAPIHRSWIISAIDTRTSQRLVNNVQETAKDAKTKLAKRETDYIGVSMQNWDDEGMIRPARIHRPVVSKLLSKEEPWHIVFTAYPYATSKVTVERATIQGLTVFRQATPQPVLDLADLPIGTCVQIRTTGSIIWLVVTSTREFRSDYDMVFGLLYSTSDPDGYSGPPIGCHRYVKVGNRLTGSGGAASSVILSYQVL